MSTLADSLPAAEAKEMESGIQFIQEATAMSLARYRAAKDLIAKVNGILPELEMKDKRASLLFKSPVDVEERLGQVAIASSSSSLDPLSVTPRGWDRVTLRVTQVQDGSPPASSASASDVTCVIGLVRSDDDSDAGGFSSDGVNDDGERVSVLGSLSSGEGARLALALESVCCYEGDDNEGTTAGNQHEEEGLLVFDEIDAHVGGDAAVAVARYQPAATLTDDASYIVHCYTMYHV